MKDIYKLSKSELMKLAKENKIKGRSKMNKCELVHMLLSSNGDNETKPQKNKKVKKKIVIKKKPSFEKVFDYVMEQPQIKEIYDFVFESEMDDLTFNIDNEKLTEKKETKILDKASGRAFKYIEKLTKKYYKKGLSSEDIVKSIVKEYNS